MLCCTIIAGITVDEGDLLPPYKDTLFVDASSTIDSYFLGTSFDKYNSGSIKLSNVRDYLQAAITYLSAGNGLDPIIICITFLFCTIGAPFFPNGNYMVLVGWLAYLDDVRKVPNYDQVSAILASIYYVQDIYC